MNDRLISPLRAAARDLIDKRLWPVAVLLVAALVAVPVVIGSGPKAPAPVPAPAPAPAAGSAPTSAITVADTAVIGRSRPGAVNDPFFDPPKPDDAADGGGTSTATAAGSVSSPSSSSPPSTSTSTSKPTSSTTATTTTPGTTTTIPPTPSAESVARRTVPRTRLRFGADEQAAVRGVSRLGALGADANPALQYLGTSSGGRYAVFLLGPKAVSEGDAECAEDTCRVIAMRPGDTQSVSVGEEDGSARRYVVKVDDIVEHVADTIAEANSLRARVAADGRDVLRAMILDKPTAAAIGRFAYDRTTGSVVTRSAS